MENQSQPTKKIIINYGVILAAISILLNVTMYALGKHYDQDWKMGLFGFIIMAVVIFMGIKKAKEFNGNILSLGQALKVGMGIALVAALIGVVYTLIFMNFIEPDFMDNMMEIQRQNMLENYPNLTDEQIEMQLEMGKKFANPWVSSAFQLIGSLFFGFIISLVSGLILKKEAAQ